MPLRNGIPFTWHPRGLSDAIDGTNAFDGAMASLSNLIPDPSTDAVWMPRPPALVVTSFSGFTTPGFISALEVIGNRAYGLIASGRNAGKDEPFCYDLLANAFITVSGITSGNTPTSPATSGAWTPPIIAQAGSRIVVTHPGFPGGQTKFGWWDVSGYNQTTIGDVVSGSPIITGSPSILGVQPGMALSGTNIAGGATVLFAQDAYTAVAFTGTSHGTFTIDSIASTTNLLPGYFLVGPGIPPSTIIEQVLANSIIISFATTSSVTATFYAYGANPSIAGGYIGTTTAGSATITTASTLGLWVGQSVFGVNIPLDSVIVSLVANTSITLNQAALGSGTQGFQVNGTVIVMSANATGTSNGGAINVAGGTFAAPQWGAGDTQPNNLPSVPVGVAQMSGRAYFALGTDGIVFSDSGFPCQVSNITRVQALRTNDGLAVTAIGPVMLATLTGGIVQCLIAFEAATKMQQITGDAATNNLSMNALPVATGTLAPLTVTPMELGLSFISPEGLRIVDFSGRVTPPLGDHGMGITTPFIYAVVPSRMTSAAASDTIRVTVQNGYKTGSPYEEYWYDLTRTIDGRNKVWHGPHTSTASMIAAWNDQFAMTLVGTTAKLFVSPAAPVVTSTYVENGNQLVWQYEPVYLMPDNQSMVMNALLWMTLACGGPNCSVIAPPEPLLYGPPLIGGPPVQPGPGPGGTPLVPNQPPPPPTQPPVPVTFAVDAADIRVSGTWAFPAMADGSLGTLSQWLYLDPATYPSSIPDLFQVYPIAGDVALVSGPGNLTAFITTAQLSRQFGMFPVAVKSISSASNAVLTLYGGNPLDQFSTLGTQVNIEIAGTLNPGWSGSGFKTVVSSTASTITLNWDTSGFPAWNEDTLFENVTFVYIGNFTISSAASAVINCSVPHGIDAGDVAAGTVYLRFTFATPTPPGGSGWDTIGATKVKVTGVSSNTITTDLNSTGFTAWTNPMQYGAIIYIPNTLSIELFGYAFDFNAGVDHQYYLTKKYFRTLPWSAWTNVIMAWDTNAAAGLKSLDVSYGETVLTPAMTDDPCPAFTIPYSKAGSTTGLETGSAASAPATWALFYQTHSYNAEVWFDATHQLSPSIAGNRHVFHDATTGKAISLGATGHMPTGSAPTFYLSLLPGALTPPPALTFVDPNGNNLLQAAATLGGIADSTSMVMSFWIDRNFQSITGLVGLLVSGAGSSVVIDNSVTPPLMKVSLNDNAGHSFIFTAPLTGIGTGANVRMSVDTNHNIGAKVVHVFVGMSSVAVTVLTDNVNGLSVHWQDGATDFFATQNNGGYIAALWFGPGQLFDVTSKFVDGSGNPVNLGANGELPSGTAPTCYFNCTGAATTFYTNLGLGGVFAFQSQFSAAFVLQNGARLTDNAAMTGNLITSLENTDIAYSTVLLAPTSPTS